jgi:hypothetical protein
MYEKAKKLTLSNPLLRKVLGGSLVLVGTVFLITPFTPGSALLLFLGFELLGLRFMFLDRMIGRKSTTSTK